MHVENIQDYSSFTSKNGIIYFIGGFSISDGNQWKSYSESKDNQILVENWGKNEYENKEWYEKWFESKKGMKELI